MKTPVLCGRSFLYSGVRWLRQTVPQKLFYQCLCAPGIPNADHAVLLICDRYAFHIGDVRIIKERIQENDRGFVFMELVFHIVRGVVIAYDMRFFSVWLETFCHIQRTEVVVPVAEGNE